MYTVQDRFFETLEIILKKSKSDVERGMARDFLSLPEEKREELITAFAEFLTHIFAGCPPFYNMIGMSLISMRTGISIEEIEKQMSMGFDGLTKN